MVVTLEANHQLFLVESLVGFNLSSHASHKPPSKSHECTSEPRQVDSKEPTTGKEMRVPRKKDWDRSTPTIEETGNKHPNRIAILFIIPGFVKTRQYELTQEGRQATQSYEPSTLPLSAFMGDLTFWDTACCSRGQKKAPAVASFGQRQGSSQSPRWQCMNHQALPRLEEEWRNWGNIFG